MPAQSSLFAAPRISQTKVDDLITTYIITEMRPIQTVEKKSFVDLVTGLAPSVTVPCRKTMATRIATKHSALLFDIKTSLAATKHVCTTADIWSSHTRSYMGMTAHWIDGYERKSATLACRRFVGSHTYDKIAEILSEVHSDFDIPHDKITSTVTDNASNFIKAFVNFPLPEVCDEPRNENDSEDDDDIQPADIAAILTGVDDTDSGIYLPPHHKCAAHTLNLIGSTDADKALTNAAYSRIHHGSFGKCQALWNAVHRSSKAADAVKAISDKALIHPCPTRWNSKFDAVHRLLDLSDKLPAICDALSLPRLKPIEMEFLREYDMVMSPLAATLDVLQGDISCFYGMLLPKLVLLRNRVAAACNGDLVHAKPLALAIHEGLTSRYGHYFSLELTVSGAILAAVSHPQFKLRWVQPDKRDEVLSMFLLQVTRAASTDTSTASAHDSTPDDEDYGYDTTPVTSNVAMSAENRAKIEAMNYLEDPSKDINSLSKYPLIYGLFVRFNTDLPSSAPVERLFSAGGLILTPRRNKLSDATFEKLLMLKTNKL